MLSNTNQSKDEELVSRIYRVIDVYNRNTGLAHKIKFAYGVVEYDSRQHSDIKILLNETDQSMYKQKKTTSKHN